jgi:hypothetical protein
MWRSTTFDFGFNNVLLGLYTSNIINVCNRATIHAFMEFSIVYAHWITCGLFNCEISEKKNQYRGKNPAGLISAVSAVKFIPVVVESNPVLSRRAVRAMHTKKPCFPKYKAPYYQMGRRCLEGVSIFPRRHGYYWRIETRR